MKNKNLEVAKFLLALNHPFEKEIEEVRDSILGADEGISEHIKWNAPSYVFNGVDRITFRLHPPKNIQLIFHRGVEVKDNANFSFTDPSGLIQWKTKDRGVVTFTDMDDFIAKRSDFTSLVKAWISVS